MQPGDTVYVKEIKIFVNNYKGKILEDLGDQVIVQIGGCKIYFNKDRVTKNIKELLDIAAD